jgi:hypothetical protein
MLDAIINKYLFFICVLSSPIFCSSRSPHQSIAELVNSPDKMLLLFLMRKPILQALLELPNRVSCWAASLTWYFLLRETSTIHRRRNKEDRQLNEKYQPAS